MVFSIQKLNSSYKWTIKDFPTLCMKHTNGSAFTSPIFWLLGHRLNFLVYPNGIDEEAEGWLSLYLEFSEEYPKSRKVINKIPNVDNAATVICRLSVKSIEPEADDVSQQALHVLKEPAGSLGWSKMIKTTEALYSKAYCNSTNGSLTIQCTIQPVNHNRFHVTLMKYFLQPTVTVPMVF
ncbi:uncharacterized protein LOC116307186 [Actinia tenebrosa]|uniref:Uncharacterized protein LOC116307186 n=1 Tax=Actinia tenebrosa TaxID=6105 RepID=A0A6P8J5J6_ACTTE|nr:uncharacterized protein LOC116307186 [Actinia tenebrosa]